MIKNDQLALECEPIDAIETEPAERVSPTGRRRGPGGTLLLILKWVGVGVGMLFAAAVVLVMVVGDGQYGKEIKLKAGSQLFYTSSVQQAEAQKVADWLNENVLNKPDAASYPGSYQLSKQGDSYELRVCIQPGKEQNPAVVTYWQAVGLLISENVFNKAPVQVFLCDDHLKTIQALPPLGAPKATEKS